MENKLSAKIIRVKADLKYERVLCTTHICTDQTISEVMEKNLCEFSPRDPILIDAQTGSGKTTAIYNFLIPYALSIQKNVFLLCNRVALSIQQKKEIMEITDTPLKGLLTEKGIQEQTIFGNVGVSTYHRLSSFLKDEKNKEWCDNLAFVIADEAHFFVSDAFFNNACNYILKQFVQHFSHAVRIYLSATPWDFMYPLAKAEEKYYNDINLFYHCYSQQIPLRPRAIQHFEFPRDYSSVNLNFFKNIEEIIDLIETNPNEKWMIFIDNMEKFSVFKNALEGKVSFLNANLKDTPIFHSLINNQKFEEQVLITTAVLDCGVNVRDASLKNIVVFSDDRTATIQMVGRKRLDKNEKVNVWIYDLDKQTVWSRVLEYNEFLDLEKEYDRCDSLKRANPSNTDFRNLMFKLWKHSNPAVRELFSPYEDRLYKNDLAFYYMHKKMRFYRQFLSGELYFRHTVEDWFNKPHSPIPCAPESLDLFYEQHSERFLGTEEQNELRQLILGVHDQMGYRQARTDRNNVLKHNALNSLLEKIDSPYRIESIQGYWFFVTKERVHSIFTSNQTDQ